MSDGQMIGNRLHAVMAPSKKVATAPPALKPEAQVVPKEE
jgi:hypothetical protein